MWESNWITLFKYLPLCLVHSKLCQSCSFGLKQVTQPPQTSELGWGTIIPLWNKPSVLVGFLFLSWDWRLKPRGGGICSFLKSDVWVRGDPGSGVGLGLQGSLKPKVQNFSLQISVFKLHSSSSVNKQKSLVCSAACLKDKPKSATLCLVLYWATV